MALKRKIDHYEEYNFTKKQKFTTENIDCYPYLTNGKKVNLFRIWRNHNIFLLATQIKEYFFPEINIQTWYTTIRRKCNKSPYLTKEEELQIKKRFDLLDKKRAKKMLCLSLTDMSILIQHFGKSDNQGKQENECLLRDIFSTSVGKNFLFYFFFK
jgi:hypothetical protein